LLNLYSFSILGGWLVIVISASLFCSKIFPKETELSRKIVHIGTGPIIPLAWWLKIPSNLAITIAFMITLALIINYRFHLISSLENISRKSFGTIAYGFSITILIFFFWSECPSAVTAGVLVMAFGDGLASLIGTKIKSPNWKIFGQRKSLAGTITMGLVGALILYTTNQIIGMPLSHLTILGITSLAVILEQVSSLGIDNISVPIAVAISWQWVLLK